MLADKGFSYRHGEDADFEAELALDSRIHEYVTAGATTERRIPLCRSSGRAAAQRDARRSRLKNGT